MGNKLDRALAVLNGLVGDYLARTNNGLATEMACYRDGRRGSRSTRTPSPRRIRRLTRARSCSCTA